MENKKENKFISFWKRIFKRADEIMFPANIKCLGCGVDLPEKREIEFCDECKKKIEYISEDKCCSLCGTSLKQKNICPHCQNNKREFDEARSVCKYNDFMASLIAKFKYHNHPYMSLTFGHMISKKFKELKYDVDLIVPVPITKKRMKQRGFNQAELIAKVFAKDTNLPLCCEIIEKQTETSHQADLDYEERQKNILGTFKVVNKKEVAGKNVLVIDDVFTTGATTSACAEVLKKAKAKHVYVLSVASTSYFDQKKPSKKVVKVSDFAS